MGVWLFLNLTLDVDGTTLTFTAWGPLIFERSMGSVARDILFPVSENGASTVTYWGSTDIPRTSYPSGARPTVSMDTLISLG